MKVYLMRHGDAKSSEEDPKRPLSDSGRAKIKKVSTSALKMGLTVQEIWHSNKLRAKETATILADSFINAIKLKELKGLAPNDDVRPMANQLMERDENIALVGHLPFLNKLASLLLCGSEDVNIINFNPGMIVCLSKEADNNWSIEWGITS